MAIIGTNPTQYQNFTEEMQTAAFQLGVGLFGIPLGTSFLSEISNYMTQVQGASIDDLYAVVLASSVGTSASYYPTYLTNEQFAERLANKLLGASGSVVTADAWTAGKDWVVSSLNTMTRAEVAKLAIEAVAGVSATDTTYGAARQMFDNKMTVAEYYTLTKNGASTDTGVLAAYLTGVTADAATVTTAQTAINNGGTDVTGGLSLTLSTGADTISGGGNNDVIQGGADTLSTSDSINGGAGTDVFTVRMGDTAVTPQITNVEVLNVNFYGNSALLNLNQADGYSAINVWGNGGSSHLTNVDSAVTVALVSGMAGELEIGYAGASNTADSATIAIGNASAYTLHESAATIENFNLVINAAAASGALIVGSATTALNISGSASAELNLTVESGSTAFNVNASALAADLKLKYSGSAQEVNITTGSAADTIVLGSSLGVLMNSLTANINGGDGADKLTFSIVTSQQHDFSVQNVETITINYDTAGVFNASGVSGMTTLNVVLGSALSSASVTKLASAVTTINLSLDTGNAGASSATFDFSYLNDASATLNVDGSNASAATATFGYIDANSAHNLTVAFAGTNNIQLGDLNANEATALTINVAADVNMSALSAVNATMVTINATAGDISIQSALLGSAQLVTINQAVGTSSYSGSMINSLLANRADLVINVGANGSANTAAVLIGTATIGNGLNIVTNGGDVVIGELGMASAGWSGQATAGTAIAVTIDAQGSADSVILRTLNVNTGGTGMNTGASGIAFTIQGLGDVSLGTAGFAIGSSMSANNTATVFNATGLQGTLTLDLDALTAGMAVQVFLGNDVASANSVLLGSGAAAGGANDTIHGGANADVIQGGGGADTLYGGAGSDVFVFLGSAGDNFNADQGSSQTDVIMDFGSGDVLRFSGIGAVNATAGSTALGGIGVWTAALTGLALTTANDIAIFQDSGNTIVQIQLVSGAQGAIGSGIIQIKLDGLGSWTSLSAVFNAAIAGGTLTITHI